MYFSSELAGSLGGKVTHTLFQLCLNLRKGQNNATVCGVDLHANMSTVYNTSEYSTYLYAMKAAEIIKNHDPRTVNSGVIISFMASQITGNSTIFSSVVSG